jgi:hypothetical protein
LQSSSRASVNFRALAPVSPRRLAYKGAKAGTAVANSTKSGVVPAYGFSRLACRDPITCKDVGAGKARYGELSRGNVTQPSRRRMSCVQQSHYTLVVHSASPTPTHDSFASHATSLGPGWRFIAHVNSFRFVSMI